MPGASHFLNSRTVTEAARTGVALTAAWRHRRAAPEQIRAYQDRRLRQLVAHAYERVPYYRKLFDQHRLRPEHIRGVVDLGLIPITPRSDVQDLAREETLARGWEAVALMERSTSGSTGQPLTIRRGWLEDRLLRGFLWRALYGWGAKTSDRLVSVHLMRGLDDAAALKPTDHRAPPSRLFRRRLHDVVPIDCRQRPEDILRQLRDIKPQVITGLPGVLTRVALLLDDEDRQLLPQRFVSPYGEVVTPLMRSRLEAGFGAPVLQTYRSIEFVILAWECGQTGEFHTCDDAVVLEVLKNGRPVEPGEHGEMVATALHSFAMPFIRYAVGDMVTRGADACVCGQPFGTIRQIQGRMIDYFVLPHGGLVHPYQLTMAFLHLAPWIREYQLVQERTDRVVLRVVPFETPTAEQAASVRQALSQRLGPGVEVDVMVVPEILLEPGGKLRPSRSLVKSEYDGIDWEASSPASP